MTLQLCSIRRSMCSFGVALPAFFFPASMDLTEWRTTSTEGSGVIANLSEDGGTIYQILGTGIVELDARQLRAWERTGNLPADPWQTLIANGTRYELDASIMKVLEHWAPGAHSPDYLYIAGGDNGVYRIDAGVTPTVVAEIDIDTGGRWCFDVELSENGDQLYALMSGLDSTELRVYDLTCTTCTDPLFPEVARIQLDTTHNAPNQMPRPSIGYGVELYTASDGIEYAFVAMGASGIVRVDWRNPTQAVDVWREADIAGGDCGFVNESYEGCSMIRRVREIAIEGGFLYAAADLEGLATIDLRTWHTPGASVELSGPLPVDPNCTASRCAYRFATRVDVVKNGTEHIVVVGTTTVPSAARESLNYYRYGSFGWDLGRPLVPESAYDGTPPIQIGGYPLQTNALVVFAHDPSQASPVQSFVDIQMHHIQERGIVSLACQVTGTGANAACWVYTGELGGWTFPLSPIVSGRQLNSEAYIAPPAEYSSICMSLLDPNLVFAGSDGSGVGSLLVVRNDTANNPVFEKVLGSQDPGIGGVYRFGLLVGAQWIEELPNNGSAGAERWEWVTHTGNDAWRFKRFREDTLQDPPVDLLSWQEDSLPFPSDPLITGEVGRSYSPSNSLRLERGSLLCLSRGGVPRGLAIYEQGAVTKAFRNSALPPGPIAQVDLHSYLPQTPIFDPDLHLPASTYGSTTFTWQKDGTRQECIALAVGAHLDPSDSANYHRARVVFVNLGDYDGAHPDLLGANYDPVQRKPVDPSRVVGVQLQGPEALAFTIQVAYLAIRGQRRPIAFIGDTAGRVTALDIGDVFALGRSPARQPVQVGQWRIAPAVFDGQRDIITDLEVDSEPSFPLTTGPKHFVYLAANRAGLIKLQATVSVTQATPLVYSIDFTHIATRNTSGQASGIDIRRVQGKKRLLLSDHGDCGMRYYGEF